MQVISHLPNMSTTVSNVKFAPVGDAMLSEDISEEAAAVFLSIPGYELYVPPLPESEAKAKAAPKA